MLTTLGTLLGGRVAHEQPREGHRTGLEPVLLAAAIPARAGERVLEGGTGSGAGLLCLAARVTGIRGVGVERDQDMAGLAQRNVATNGLTGAIEIVMGDVPAFRAGAVDHAFANPPWHDADGTASPMRLKEAAKRAAPGGLAAWIAALAKDVRDGGTVTVVVPAACVPECLGAMAANGCGSVCLCPLWPRQGRAAKLVLLQAVRRGRGPFRLLPGLVLHGEAGFTPETAAILDGAAALATGRSVRVGIRVAQAP